MLQNSYFADVTALKYRAMRDSPFRFSRGVCPLTCVWLADPVMIHRMCLLPSFHIFRFESNSEQHLIKILLTDV